MADAAISDPDSAPAALKVVCGLADAGIAQAVGRIVGKPSIKPHRNQYRAMPDVWQGLEISLRDASGTFPAQLHDATGRGMSVAFEVDLAPSLALGSSVVLRLNAFEFPEPLEVVAIVVRIEHADEQLLLGLQFLDWLGLAAAVPKSFASLFNLRAKPRLHLGASQTMPVVIRDSLGAFDLRGVMHDVSSSGMSFSTELLSQCILNRVDQVVLAFHLPDIERKFTFGSRIRYRSLQGESLRYGVWFDATATKDFVAQQRILGTYVEQRLAASLKLVTMT